MIKEGQTGYVQFAEKILKTGIISDPWVDGNERFLLKPHILDQETWKRLVGAVESVGAAFNELVDLLWSDPNLLERSYPLTEWQRRMWISSAGIWHGIARADAFILEDGSIRICELNADTPSGEPETVLLNRALFDSEQAWIDPNIQFREKFIEMVARSHSGRVGGREFEALTVGIVYPTDIPEDLSMIELYRKWMLEKGWRVVLGSPYNIQSTAAGRIEMFGSKLDILFRHYKTDWWGERVMTMKSDLPFLDPDPIEEPLRAVLSAEASGLVTVINPFGAMIPQNKLSMALMHSEINQFSDESQRAIRSYIPVSRRLSECDIDLVIAEKDKWVLKSDFGCEGAEVVIGRGVDSGIWEKTLRDTVAEHWMVQEYFEARKEDDGLIPNYGLFLVGGEGGPIFTRYSSATTDYSAVTPPTFVVKE